MVCEKLGIYDKLYLKYEADALREYSDDFMSAAHIAALADEAGLLPEHKENLVNYMNYADDDVKRFMWIFYYVQFKTQEDFSDDIWQMDKWGIHEESEKLYPGMFKACVYLLAAEHLRSWLEERELPKSILENYFGRYHYFIKLNLATHNTNGFCRLSPFLYAYAKPFSMVIGRLAFQLTKYKNYCEVYENAKGERFFAALPNYTYDVDGHICENGITPVYSVENNILTCQSYRDDGTLSDIKTELDLSEYTKILSPGDVAVTIHIPEGGKLSSELVHQSIKDAWPIINKFIAKPKALVCWTWFIDPGLRDVIKDGSNMRNFANLFDVICVEDNDNHSIFEHVFVTKRTELTNLKPQNEFQRKILERAISGKKIYWSYGLLKKEYEYLLNDK